MSKRSGFYPCPAVEPRGRRSCRRLVGCCSPRPSGRSGWTGSSRRRWCRGDGRRRCTTQPRSGQVAVMVDAYNRSPHTPATAVDNRSEARTVADQHRDVSPIMAKHVSPDQRVRGSSPWRRTILPGQRVVASRNCATCEIKSPEIRRVLGRRRPAQPVYLCRQGLGYRQNSRDKLSGDESEQRRCLLSRTRAPSGGGHPRADPVATTAQFCCPPPSRSRVRHRSAPRVP